MALHELQDKIERLYESNREEVIPFTKEKGKGKEKAQLISVSCPFTAPPRRPTSRRFNVSSPICSISDMDMGGRGRGEGRG